MEAVVEQGEQVVGDDAFQGFVVIVAEADPEAVQFGPGKEGFAFGFEVVGEIADEIDGTDFGERELLVLAVRGEEVDGIGLAKAGRIQVAAYGLFVGQNDDDFLVGGGWGASFHA